MSQTLVNLFERSISPGDTVVDIGAYLGHSTLVAANRAGPRGRVYSFEPNPAAFRALRRNLRTNGLEDRVFAVPAALAGRPEWRDFYVEHGDGSASSLHEPRRWRRKLRVECTTLDRVVGERPVDVIKLDVEGAELEALRGMSQVIESSPRLRMFIECDRLALALGGTSVGAVLHELRMAGLSVRLIDEARGEIVPLDSEPARLPSRVNLYCASTRAGEARSSLSRASTVPA